MKRSLEEATMRGIFDALLGPGSPTFRGLLMSIKPSTYHIKCKACTTLSAVMAPEL